MEQRRLGRTGLTVSSLGLGTMMWGRDTEEPEAGEQLEDFVDAGGTVLDTASFYSDGEAESLLGRLLDTVVPREDLVIVTKAGSRERSSGSTIDASRGNLLTSLETSLTRLNTDHVDLWLVASPDHATPIEETVSAMKIAVESGKTRYVGLSNFPAWRTSQVAQMCSEAGIGMSGVEMEYSLLQRGIEREMLPAAAELGFGVLAWSPLGRGILTGKYRGAIPADSRAASAHLGGFVRPYLTTRSAAIVESLATAADGLGRSPMEIALAWATGAPGLSCAIVGARTAAQLRGSLSATNLELPSQIRDALDEVSSIDVGYPERF